MADLKIFGTLNIVKKYFDIYRINLCIQNQHNCMKNNITQYLFFFFIIYVHLEDVLLLTIYEQANKH